jgi:hypothetical protein
MLVVRRKLREANDGGKADRGPLQKPKERSWNVDENKATGQNVDNAASADLRLCDLRFFVRTAHEPQAAIAMSALQKKEGTNRECR